MPPRGHRDERCAGAPVTAAATARPRVARYLRAGGPVPPCLGAQARAGARSGVHGETQPWRSRSRRIPAEGALTGVVDAAGRLRDVLETSETIRLAPIRGLALDGRTLESPGEDVPVDALLMVVPDDVDVPVHAAWHDIRLTIGPYQLDGELPTMPGFDPGRALARPTGTFVLLQGGDGDRARRGRIGSSRTTGACSSIATTSRRSPPRWCSGSSSREPARSSGSPTTTASRRDEVPTHATGDAATAGEASPVA